MSMNAKPVGSSSEHFATATRQNSDSESAGSKSAGFESSQAVAQLTHLDASGSASMVNVSQKPPTHRRAVARGRIYMQAETLEAVKANAMKKGDVLAVARIGAISGAKRTSELIALCHPIMISGIDVEFELGEDGEQSYIEIEVAAHSYGPTGIEMEALCGVSAAALSIYDMCKGVDKTMQIGEIALWHKSGGRSGIWDRKSN